MNEYGCDPWQASNLLASYHDGQKQVVETICNHVNAVASFDIPLDFKEEQSSVSTNAEQLKMKYQWLRGFDSYCHYKGKRISSK
jgi:hypothetical protein